MAPREEYCFLWINWWATCMEKAEWASWVQAVFSVIAIAAALGVAAWQRRQDMLQRVAIDRAIGQVVAASVCHSLAKAQGLIEAIADSLTENWVPGRIGMPHGEVELLKTVVIPPDEDLLRIAPCWPDAARNISFGRSLYEAASDSLEFALNHRGIRTTPLETTIGEVTVILKEAVEHFDAAHKRIDPEGFWDRAHVGAQAVTP
jgi:hypothetical protein